MTAMTGRLVVVDEADYAYGVGPLRLRVRRVDRAHPVRYAGDSFYRVEGMQVTADGTELGHREVLIRSSRLPLA